MRRKHFWGQLPPEWGQPRRTALFSATRTRGLHGAASAFRPCGKKPVVLAGADRPFVCRIANRGWPGHL
jgi:hypothetical protein